MADGLALRQAERVDPDAALTALVAALAEVPGIALRRSEPLSAHTVLRCGGPADLYAVVADEEALEAILRAARQHGVPWRLLWPFEEALVRDGGHRGLLVRPGRGFEGIALLPQDDEGPPRLRLGAAAPWAAARAARSLAHHLVPPADLARGAVAAVARWPGCPGALLQSGDPAALEGLVHALTWRKGRKVERTVLADGAPPPTPPPSAVLLHVELPLGPHDSGRRPKHRPSPPPPGTLFADEGPLKTGPQLVACGLVGTRLRAWRLARTEPGVLVNLGDGDCQTALLLAKGVAEHANRKRGLQLQQRIPVIGSDGPRRR